MVSKEIKFTQLEIMNAKLCLMVVEKANFYKAGINIAHKEKTANAKSLIGLISLALKKGQVFNVSASGKDEIEAIEGICDLLKSFDK